MKVNIACLQMASHPYDWNYNIEKATSMIQEAASNGANICVLPETFIPGYSYSRKNFQQAETLNVPTISTLIKLAKELNIYITGSIIEKSSKHFYNTMVFLGPEGILGSYHKVNVFSLENKYWKRGKEGTIITSKYGRIGLGICADMQYSKLWKQYAGKVNLILICSAWPEKPANRDLKFAVHGEQLCKDLPIQISNKLKVPTAYCNACHTCEGKTVFVGVMRCQGFSKIVDNGRIIASINSREEKVIQGVVNTPEEPPEIDLSGFKNWIDYSFGEKITKFFVEKTGKHISQLYYRWKKKKYLKKY